MDTHSPPAFDDRLPAGGDAADLSALRDSLHSLGSHFQCLPPSRSLGSESGSVPPSAESTAEQRSGVHIQLPAAYASEAESFLLHPALLTAAYLLACPRRNALKGPPQIERMTIFAPLGFEAVAHVQPETHEPTEARRLLLTSATGLPLARVDCRVPGDHAEQKGE